MLTRRSWQTGIVGAKEDYLAVSMKSRLLNLESTYARQSELLLGLGLA